MTVLYVKNLNKFFGENHVLKNVSLEIKEGEVVCVLGRNGAGKTTFIESLFNLNIINDGIIKFFDLKTQSLKENNVKNVGVQLQISDLFPNQTVYETIETFNIIKGNITDITQVINQFCLENILKKKVKCLSLGQMQRLMVCLAFIGHPKFLVLDEPTSGIDPQIRKIIWNNIISFKKQNNSILFTTHDMNDAYLYSDKIVIIDGGKVVENDTPKNLLFKYQKDNLEDAFLKITGEKLREVD